MRVVIVGIGEIGLELAKDLSRKKDNELVLVDIDENWCNQLASDIDALVLQGDGSDPEILKKAKVEEADALVATTGTDAINTVIAMLGRRLKVPKVIVKLTKVGLRSACQEIGVSAVIMPKISAAAEIISTLYGFDWVNFSLVTSGGLRLELVETGGVVGQRLSDQSIPDGVHIVAVLRGEQALIPRTSLKLEPGDELLLLIEDSRALDKMREQLSTKEAAE